MIIGSVYGIIGRVEFKIIKNPAEMDLLSHEWDSLLESSASRVPFLRYDYQKIWLNTMGGGEWKDTELTIVAGFQDGSLVGIAPLFFSINKDNQPALLLIGSIEVSDYLDLIVSGEAIPAFVDSLFDFLGSAPLPSWQVLDWYNIPEDSPTLPAIKAAAIKHGWSFSSTRIQPTPQIALPGDWETYLAGIDKKQRHEIRRKMRRLEESGRPSHFYVVTDESTLDGEIDSFFTLMRQDEQKALFLTEKMETFLRELIHGAFTAHYLEMAFLEIDGIKAAAYLNFTYLDRIWVYNSGLDSRFIEFSPGWVLLAYLLKKANEEKKTVFDFMRGDEEYKYRFGAINHYVVRVIIQR